jgi:hypothetical protein
VLAFRLPLIAGRGDGRAGDAESPESPVWPFHWRVRDAVRWTITVKARCGETSTVVVAVYRQLVWLSIVPFFNSEAMAGSGSGSMRFDEFGE